MWGSNGSISELLLYTVDVGCLCKMSSCLDCRASEANISASNCWGCVIHLEMLRIFWKKKKSISVGQTATQSWDQNWKPGLKQLLPLMGKTMFMYMGHNLGCKSQGESPASIASKPHLAQLAQPQKIGTVPYKIPSNCSYYMSCSIRGLVYLGKPYRDIPYNNNISHFKFLTH